MFDHRADPNDLDDADRLELYQRVVKILHDEGAKGATVAAVERIAQRGRNAPEDRIAFTTRLSPHVHAHLGGVASALGLTMQAAADEAILGRWPLQPEDRAD